jgi:hypothetical protein
VQGCNTVAKEEDGEDGLDQTGQTATAAQLSDALDPVENGQWCDLTIIAQGRHFSIRLNRVIVVDTRDEHPRKFVASGMLGFEYMHRQGVSDFVEFKNIRLKRLEPAVTEPNQ